MQKWKPLKQGLWDEDAAMLKKRGLGRGLSELGLNELLSDNNTEVADLIDVTELKKLPLASIYPGRYQPRRQMSQEALEELALSIRAQGVIQPIVVRRHQDGYEIIAGERRWRAAQLAGLAEIPALIRELSDDKAMAIGLIENIQRQDLNAVEEAIALDRLLHEFQMTHQEIADVLGKSRVTITNTLRLLKLNPDVRLLVEKNLIDMGHARALLGIEGHLQSQLANTIVARGLSVREAEKLIRDLQENHEKKATAKKPDPDITRLQNELSDRLGAVIRIRHQNKGKGKLVIFYNSVDELSGILDRIQ